MKSIHIDASVSYDVVIGEDLLQEAGDRICRLGNAGHTVIVSDDQVYPLYGEQVKNSLEHAGIQVQTFVFPHGEQSKNLVIYEKLLEYLCSCHLTRADLLIALGGGVTGDLTGFAAATYQRGIRCVQIPTTLLAAVDSSVGGKTAVNLKGGKNQVGCFLQPSLVLCDTSTLATLPEEEFRSGSAEVIKYGMIQGSINPGKEGEFFDALARNNLRSWLPEVIGICVEMKRDVVMRDEFDTGERMLLNFGHTLGHGVEKCSHYAVPHGMGVAMGMARITESAEQKGFCEKGTAQALIRVLDQYHLPTEIPYDAAEIAAAAMADKKNTGKTLRIIVPEKIGKCRIQTISAEELIEWL